VADEDGEYPHGSVLGHAQQTLLAFHHACQESGHHKKED
jgi:hypothetical protein